MTRQLRVAYILHRFPYLTETFIMREVYWLRQQGVDVEIYSLLSPQHAVVHEQAEELLEVTHYSPFMSWEIVVAQLFFLFRSPLRYLKAFYNLLRQTIREPRVLIRSLVLFPKSVLYARLIQAKQFDHIHSHFVWIDGIAAGVVSDLIGTTFSIHPHAFGLFSRHQKSVKRELEHATQIVTISNFHRKYINDLCPQLKNQVEVVYCALETDRLQPLDRGFKAGPFKILSVGRMIEKKGFEYLIESCQQLRQKGFEINCTIVGGGTLKNQLNSLIQQRGLEDCVFLAGSMSQKQVLEHYRQADVFALPCVVASDGDRDGIPVVLMEAMAFEIPVVTTPITGIPDLVQDQHNGLMVKERDTQSLTTAIETLIGDEALRERLGRNGRQTILATFDIRKNTAKLASIFKRVSKTDFPDPPFELSKPRLTTPLQQTST